jgi:hypothetical protein
LWRSIKPTMYNLNCWKMRELQQYLQSIAYLPFSHNLSNKGKNTMEKKNPPRNEQPWILAYILVL